MQSQPAESQPVVPAGPDVEPPKKRAEPMLAWWGFIPAVAFVVFHSTYGWAEAKSKATAPDFAMSYLVGGDIGGCLIALLIAWIFYRIFRRSQITATIVFTLILALASYQTVRSGRYYAELGNDPALAAQSADAPLQEIPLAGISLSSPPGWQQVPPDRPGVIARWISRNPGTGEVAGMIMIEMKKAQGKTARQIADALAEPWGGRVVEQSDVLDGVGAYRIMVDHPPSGLQPVEGLVAVHSDRVYLIEGGASPGIACHDQVQAIHRSWRWILVQSQADHLEVQSQPLAIINDQILIKYPTVMTPFDLDNPDKGTGLGLYNFKRNAVDFDAVIQLLPLQDGQTLETVETRLGTGMQAQLNLPEAFEWHKLASPSHGAITQPVRYTQDHVDMWMIWAVVGVDEKRLMLINFTLKTPDMRDRAKYADAARQMAESIAPNPAKRK